MKTEGNRSLAEVLRDEMVMKDRIVGLLREEPKTIPELAEALGYPSHEVVLWVMALWRYGTVAEMKQGRNEEYFKYTLSASH
ncbi:MAG: MarR family transcriptional regulator [Acidobacteria bacterium]|nr:MarR family transcriptional regulator [Acidobacteriota bacterium]